MMKISESLDFPTKVIILKKVWKRSQNQAEKEAVEYAYYFQRYDVVCKHRLSFLDERTHEELAEIAEQMPTASKEECSKKLTAMYALRRPSAEDQDAAVCFIAKLFFCVDLTQWQGSETLATYLQNLFTRSTQDDRYRMSRSFNACNIDRITDINVAWTWELNKHLHISDDNGDIAMFHCVSILQLFEVSETGKILIPQNLIQETRESLTLMCPNGDDGVKRWLKAEQQKYQLDAKLQVWCAESRLGIAGRNIQRFSFWRDHLIMIKEVYDEREPRSIKHWWRDGRRPMQWWTFWLALLAFTLSLMACILGSMQVYKAYHPTPERISS